MTERYNKHMGIVCQIPDIPLTSPAKNGRQTSNARRSAVFWLSSVELVDAFSRFSRALVCNRLANLKNFTLIYFAISGPLGKLKFPAPFSSFQGVIWRSLIA